MARAVKYPIPLPLIFDTIYIHTIHTYCTSYMIIIMQYILHIHTIHTIHTYVYTYCAVDLRSSLSGAACALAAHARAASVLRLRQAGPDQ